MVNLFIRSALLGTLAGLPCAAVAGGLTWAALHGHDLPFAGGCALFVLLSACLSPWGLFVVCGCGILGVLRRPVSDRLPPAERALFWMGLCLVVWIAPMAWYRTAIDVAPTPEGIREIGGKPRVLFPYWIGFAALAGGMSSGLALRPRDPEPRTSTPFPRYVGGLTFAAGLLLFLLAYLLLWGLSPLYERMFDT